MTALTPQALLWVALGGAIGSVLRFSVSVVAAGLLGPNYPWGTLLVNIIGSALIGVAVGVELSGTARLLLVTGMLGGFTTFSAFSAETLLLWERGWWQAALYVGLSVGLGLAACAIAWVATRSALH
ncbi:fluoride efflux transporter CrcB [Humitalea sp. 24SJ18S-53]|uniref:fluoride efflux transporter CrcB n=1 Tax=Humitalea sp. 24SJ18S-53 TaxID=3422307 RepID=UPI003D677D70